MSEILIVGDIHLNTKSPVARKEDDWQGVLFDKIRQIEEIAIGNGIEKIVYLGDFFDVPNIRMSFICDVISLLKQNTLTESYCIAGNHELLWGKRDQLKNSPLRVLFESGAMKNLCNHTDDLANDLGADVTAQHFLKDGSEYPKGDGGIAFTHQYIEPPFGDKDKEVIDEEIIKTYDWVFCGHDHRKIHRTIEGTEVILPGAITRLTSKWSDQSRDVSVVVFDGDQWEEKYLDLKDISDTFDERHLRKKERNKGLDDYIDQINNSEMQENDFSDVEKKVRELSGEDSEVTSTVMQYLKSEGVV
jgi:predicted phosphodiesterase